MAGGASDFLFPFRSLNHFLVLFLSFPFIICWHQKKSKRNANRWAPNRRMKGKRAACMPWKIDCRETTAALRLFGVYFLHGMRASFSLGGEFLGAGCGTNLKTKRSASTTLHQEEKRSRCSGRCLFILFSSNGGS